MSQLDWVGGPSAPRKSFRDIRNQRPSTAERKAQLCMEIRALAMKPPPCVLGGGVQAVRTWRVTQENALKVAAGVKSSVVQLELAVKSLEAFQPVTA